MNKAIWWVVGIIVIILLGWWMWGSNPTTTTQTDNTETTEEVTTDENTANSPTVNENASDEIVAVEVSGNSQLQFDPKEIRVKVGSTVRLTFNNVGGTHDWRVDEFDAATQVLRAGQNETIEFVADRAGSFEYYCSVGNHRELGMVGTLIVE